MTTEISDPITIRPNPPAQDPRSQREGLPWKNRPDKETLDYITPFAFHVDPALIGKPLAKPRQRAMAQLLDFTLIAILGSAPLFISLLFLTYMLLQYRYIKSRTLVDGEVKRIKGWAISANFMLAFFFVTCASIFIDSFKEEDSVAFIDATMISNDDVALSLRDNIRFNTYLAQLENSIDRADCESVSCYQRVLEGLPAFLTEIKVQPEDVDNVFDRVVPLITLTEVEQQQVGEQLRAEYLQAFNNAANEQDISSPEDRDVDERNTAVAWLLKQLDELGLGFGWAAFYFSAMTTWFNGRTLGKRLFSIRVVKLDGGALTLWESFGRYGGYGAGLATGLLGFLQVYWDANRQAIQDKIAGTVVVRD